jgi:lactose/L-arabinose transport system substrate-binding protein
MTSISSFLAFRGVCRHPIRLGRLASRLGLVILIWAPPSDRCWAMAGHGPGVQQHSSPRSQLVVWSWNIAANSLTELLPAFREVHPEVDVTLNRFGSNMARARFLLTLAAGAGAPDVAQVEAPYVARYAATGQLVDLTEAALKYRTMYPEPVWSNCLYEGRVYAIPWDIGPCAVFYKSAVLAQFGVAPERIETWDDFIAAGSQVVGRSGGKTRMLPVSRGEAAHMLELLMQQTGAQCFDQNGRVAIRSPAMGKALEILRRLVHTGISANIAPYGPELFATINNATIATYPMPVWFGGMIHQTVDQQSASQLRWSLMRLPAAYPGGIRTAIRGGSTLVIPRQSDEQAAAWDFIEYMLCRTESQLQHYANSYLVPAFLPALEHADFDRPDRLFGNQRMAALFVDQLNDVPSMHRTTDWYQAERHLNQVLNGWLNGDQSADEFMRELEGQLSRLTGRRPAKKANRRLR